MTNALTTNRGYSPYALFLCFTFLCLHSRAQDYAGFRTGNYTGVTGVFSNPANIADSRYRWDVNLFSLNVMAGNDKADFKLSDLAHSLNGDSLKNKLTGPHAGLTNAMANLTFTGPSVMFSIGKKNAIALTTRARVMVNVKNVDGTFINQFASQDANDASLPYSFSTPGNNMISINAWTEFGASFARVLVDKGFNYLKGGLTLKYLAGMANGYFQMDHLQGTLAADNTGVYMTNTSGLIGLGFGGTSIDDVKNGHLGGLKSSGFGADLGFVYEFKPTHHEYLLRAGVALLDLGSISYSRDTSRSSTYTAHIASGQKSYLNDFGDVDNYNQYLQSHPQYFTRSGNTAGSYSVGLPTTLQVDLDYHIFKGFYTNLNGQFSLASGDKPYNSSYYNAYTLTPRFEGRRFGFYLPVNYNQLTHFNAGFCFRAGPFFVGSGSAVSAALGSSKQADFFFGFRFGGLRRS